MQFRSATRLSVEVKPGCRQGGLLSEGFRENPVLRLFQLPEVGPIPCWRPLPPSAKLLSGHSCVANILFFLPVLLLRTLVSTSMPPRESRIISLCEGQLLSKPKFHLSPSLSFATSGNMFTHLQDQEVDILGGVYLADYPLRRSTLVIYFDYCLSPPARMPGAGGWGVFCQIGSWL